MRGEETRVGERDGRAVALSGGRWRGGEGEEGGVDVLGQGENKNEKMCR